ncbi:hypothetical protein L593_12515 [Salinarchaeum sp. Harcht-Bsk1]|uniref:hypothetical protein n=1 Tax=Salinarchaeum sp. Harcht-Bsk1 TaxID=1333523 RepID=UPI0003422AB6|nr:hypothetical protein [Salinarchaeum sp. Harcht-Bsk1]AGN02442.1 hypothetical protein L593_12515 [Salinarchaeum sp. Harcht-Bsk1]
MSSTKDSPTDDSDRTPWDELSTARQRVVLTIAHVHGPQTFNRPDLCDDVAGADDVEDVIDDKDRVLTSLDYTRLLNDLTEDGYLVKEFQGGTNPIILDVEYDSDRDTRNAAPWGNASALHTLVDQVCEREGITRDLLDEVDNEYDFNEVKNKVNGVVGRTVLQPYADPSKYRFTKEGYSLVFEKVEAARDLDE